MMGAAISMVVSYFAMFLGITWKAQRVFPVTYQWRRVGLTVLTAAALTSIGKALDVGLAGVVALVLAYPVALALLGFYLPEERRRIVAFGRRVLPGTR
jgi:hypothetical protein